MQCHTGSQAGAAWWVHVLAYCTWTGGACCSESSEILGALGIPATLRAVTHFAAWFLYQKWLWMSFLKQILREAVGGGE